MAKSTQSNSTEKRTPAGVKETPEAAKAYAEGRGAAGGYRPGERSREERYEETLRTRSILKFETPYRNWLPGETAAFSPKAAFAILTARKSGMRVASFVEGVSPDEWYKSLVDEERAKFDAQFERAAFRAAPDKFQR